MDQQNSNSEQVLHTQIQIAYYPHDSGWFNGLVLSLNNDEPKKKQGAQNTSHLIGDYTQSQRSNMKHSVAVIIGVWMNKIYWTSIGDGFEKKDKLDSKMRIWY